MLQEMAARIKAVTGKQYKWQKRRIKYVICDVFLTIHNVCYSCLAHIINLATQALIGAYSKSLHFDPKSPDDHIPTNRDKVGLIRAIAVKVEI